MTKNATTFWVAWDGFKKVGQDSNCQYWFEFAEAYAALRSEELESQVRDLTRPIDGTFVLSAEPTKEEISQARQVIGQLQREVHDLTGERDYTHLIVCNYHNSPIGGPGCICEVTRRGDNVRLRDNVERLESQVRELKDRLALYEDDIDFY